MHVTRTTPETASRSMAVPTETYVVVTPARDEEEHIEGTLQSMIAQTARPACWVIVNDGSTDKTGEILDRYAAEHDWIRVVHREDRGFRAAGSGVMEAFYAGFEVLDVDDWDFLVKFDGDLTFGPEYFEQCLAEFRKHERLGIGGGVIYNLIDGEEVLEKHPKFHVRGATKIYRRACWDDIEGLIRQPGWDTLDEVHACMHEWETRSFPNVRLVQTRFTGAAAGQWSNWVKNGRASYIVGYHPLFLVAKAGARAFRTPFLTATFGILTGFFGAWIRRDAQIENRQLIRYLRGQQLRRLFGMKSVWR